jgi:hypothetical protein
MKQFTVPSSFKMLVAGGSWMCELHYMACKKKKDKPSMKITTTKYKKLKIKITTAENWVCDITQKSGFAVGSERR